MTAPRDDSDESRIATGQFNTTRWSVVLAAGEDGSTEPGQAMQTLCHAYWYPLYAYVRRAGHSPEDAQDLTQEFFARLLQKNYVAKARRERGRFRSFLLTSLKHFLTNEYHRNNSLKRRGTQNMVSFDNADAEHRYELEPVDNTTPESLYEWRWALALLENTLARVREDYAAKERGLWFDLLKPYVWGDRNATSYAEIATQLDLTEEAVKKAVQRLRDSYRDRLRHEIAQTVSTAVEVEAELQNLMQILRR